jgi:hypothetical protein
MFDRALTRRQHLLFSPRPLGEAPSPVIAKHREAHDTQSVTGAKQSSAGGTTYGLRVLNYYVNPGLLRRISLTTYRKCGGGFAMTGADASPREARREKDRQFA